MAIDNTAGEVTVELLRELLGADAAEASLVLEAGQVRVSSEPGGLALVSREELLERIGKEPDATQLTEQADLLNTEIRLLGA
ncbi:hypothetical protein [Nocardia sp. NPDC048505]|uniref:hypothetical protein n=1 Tax=unclassified Nocardia TaxID=2637762 RepID=UPI0033F47564